MIGMWEVGLGEAWERGMNGRRKIKPLQISGKNLFGGEQESGDEDWEYFPRSWLSYKEEGKERIIFHFFFSGNCLIDQKPTHHVVIQCWTIRSLEKVTSWDVRRNPWLSTAQLEAIAFFFLIIKEAHVLSRFGCFCLSVTYGLYPSRLLCPWDSVGKNTGVGCHFLLQGIFLNQRLNSSPASPALAGYMDWFLSIEIGLHSCNKFHLVMTYSFIYFWTLFANIWWIFAMMRKGRENSEWGLHLSCGRTLD